MCDIISPFHKIRTHTAAYLHVENLSKAVTGDFQRKSGTQYQHITSLYLERYRDITAPERNVLFLSHKTTFKLHGILLMKQLRHQM